MSGPYSQMLAGFGSTLAPVRRRPHFAKRTMTATQSPSMMGFGFGDDYGASQDDAAAGVPADPGAADDAGQYAALTSEDTSTNAALTPAQVAATQGAPPPPPGAPTGAAADALPWINDTASIFGAAASLLNKAPAPRAYVDPAKSNATLYLALGGVALLGIVLFMSSKKGGSTALA